MGGAGRDLDGAGPRVERPELVDPGHRDPDPVPPPGDVPRARETVAGRGAPRVSVSRRRRREPLRAVPGQRPDLAGSQAEAAQRVVHRVGHDDVVARLGRHVVGQQAQSVGLLEPRAVRGPVRHPGLPGADASHDALPVLGELDDLVVPGVGHQEATAGQADRLGGEPQVPLDGRRRHVGRVTGLQRPPGTVLLAQLGEQGVDRVRVPLARVLRHDVPLGVDQHERGPGPRGVGLPRHQVRVVEDRVAYVVALDRRGERVRVGLVGELGRVHPDDDELPGVLLLDLTQLVEDVQAVHAAEGPEVQERETPTEIGERQRPARVQPAAAAQLRGADSRADAHGDKSAGRGCAAPCPVSSRCAARIPVLPPGTRARKGSGLRCSSS